MRAPDAATLLGERSKAIKALEASGDAGRKGVRTLEGRISEEEALHCKSRQELEVGGRAGE